MFVPPRHSLPQTLGTLRASEDESYGEAQRELDPARGRLMLAFIGFFYPVFVGLDVLVYPEWLAWFVPIRAGVVVTALAALWLTRTQGFLARPLAMAMTVLATTSVSLMAALSEGFQSHYVIGVILCFLAITTIEVYRPMGLLCALLGLTLVHTALNVALDPDWVVADLVAVSAYLVGSAVFCVTASMLLEAQRRMLFAANTELERRHVDLERAHRHQGEFLRTVSHELRSPINTVLGFAALIGEREAALHPKSKRNLELITTSAERLLRLINDLLDLSKIEAGRMELFPSDFDLSEVARQVGEGVEVLLGSRAVDVVVDVPDQLIVHSDEARVRQILTNLASNAARFTEHGRIRLWVVAREGDVTIEVTDTGVGIPEAARATIFEAFRQAHGATTAGGTGLGLSIVAYLIELLGGSIEVQSQVGVGSTFKVSLGDIKAKVAA